MPSKHFFTLIFVISVIVYCSNVYSKISLPSPCPSSPIKQTFIRNINYICGVNFVTQKHTIVNCFNIFQIFILFSGLISLLWLFFLHTCTQVRYVTFNTNLNLYNKKSFTPSSLRFIRAYFSYFCLALLLSEYPEELLVLIIIRTNSIPVGVVIDKFSKIRKRVSQILFTTLSFYIFHIAFTPAANFLCLLVFQIWCHSGTKNVRTWLPIILILLSNDVHLNPGPYFQKNCLNFMSWNVNSLTNYNFNVFISLKLITPFLIMI